MTARLVPPLLALLAQLAATAPAQTFVVDANNGPGTNFTSIAAAVAAVPDGAVLEVRPGSYDSFAVQNKSLTVLGEPGAAITAAGLFSNVYIDVVDLSAAQAVTLRGLAFSGATVIGTVGCRNCAGTVLVDRCTIGNSTGTLGKVSATNCDRVVVRDCSIRTREFLGGAVRCFDSNILLTGCDVDSVSFAIQLGSGRVHATDCVLASTPQGSALATAVCFLAGGTLALNGGTRLSSTSPNPQQAAAGNGTVAYDPNTSFVGLANPRFDPNLAVTARAIPELTVSQGLLGGVATGSLAVPIGGTGALFVGFPGSPSSAAGVLDPIWLAPGAVLQNTGPGPTVGGAYAVPNAPWVVGVQIAWQGVVLDPNGAVSASNVAAYAHF